MHNSWEEIDTSSTWQKLWKINVPIKVKTFLWRVLTNCLPTRVNLRSKMLQIDVICPFCGTEAETTEHSLIHCLFARTCWSLVCPDSRYDSAMSFSQWFDYILEHYRDKVTLISMICWGIWKARNDLVCNDKSMRAGIVVYMSIAYLTQWDKVQGMGSSSPTSPVVSAGSLERWTKPHANSVKINCDASTFIEPNRVDIGWLARNSAGDLLFVDKRCLEGDPESFWAEAFSILEALSWIKKEEEKRSLIGNNQQMSYVEESDCHIVVQAIRNNDVIHSPFGTIIEDRRTILNARNNA